MSPALMLAGAAVCEVGFVATVARHERTATDLAPSWREVAVEGLWLAPAIGLTLGAVAAWVWGPA